MCVSFLGKDNTQGQRSLRTAVGWEGRGAGRLQGISCPDNWAVSSTTPAESPPRPAHHHCHGSNPPLPTTTTPQPPHDSSGTVSNVMSSYSGKQRGGKQPGSSWPDTFAQSDQWMDKCARRLAIQCCPLVELNLQHRPNNPRRASTFSGVYILIAVGALMMLVGFLGCYGAIQESQCLLGTVSILKNIKEP